MLQRRPPIDPVEIPHERSQHGRQTNQGRWHHRDSLVAANESQRMAPSENAETASQSSAACSSGRQPTARNVGHDSRLPIRKSVTVKPARPKADSAPQAGRPPGSNVAISEAAKNRPTNQGTAGLVSRRARSAVP